MARPTTFAPAPFPAPVRASLLDLLGRLHRDAPFGPGDVRDAARRVAAAVEQLGLEPVIVRGGLDVGGAELDHVFVVVADRVVDAALPVRAASFAEVVRAWVAGDLGLEQLEASAARHGLEDRVVGEYPRDVRYRGAPLWGSAA